MDTQFKICNQCSTKLPFDAAVCPRCGTPAPESFFIPMSPETPQPAGTSRGTQFWLGLTAIIGGILCACVALSLMVFYWIGNGRVAAVIPPTSAETATIPALSPTAPVALEISVTETLIPVEIASPTDPPPAQEPTQIIVTETQSPPPESNPRLFFDDFSDPESGWKRVQEDTYTMDYTGFGEYTLVLRITDQMLVAYAPYPFTDPAGMIINVSVMGNGENGAVGVMCHLQDQNNYYRVSFRENRYGIDKVIGGKLIELTQPYWKEIIAYEPEADGMLKITLACLEGRIQLLVNDVGQEIITDTDLTSGEAAIFIASGTEPDANGIYMEGYFDDFFAEIP